MQDVRNPPFIAPGRQDTIKNTLDRSLGALKWMTGDTEVSQNRETNVLKKFTISKEKIRNVGLNTAVKKFSIWAD
jgi:hypothetical protein